MSSLRSDHCASCVKLYLISNPEDSVVERRALREDVFPRLKEHCRNTLGVEFTVTDPYESSDPSRWPDQKTRHQLIDECKNNSNGPFLLALVGHQYGTASLPSHVEVSEFQLLLHACQQAGITTKTLEKAYLVDENSKPVSYRLQIPVGMTNNPMSSKVLEVFQTALDLCVQEGLMTQERAHNHLRSELDADLRFALENGPCNDIARRCLIYVHKIINAQGRRSGSEQMNPKPHLTPQILPSDDHCMSQLRDDFLPSLITSSHLPVYTTTTECDYRHGYTLSRRRAYGEALGQQLYSDLLDLINDRAQSASTEPSSVRHLAHLGGDVLAREQAGQQELSRIFSLLFDIIRPEEEEIKTYLLQSNRQCPLVLGGGPCSGKTVLLAHCCQQIKSWLADQEPLIIPYFANMSINLSPKHLLSSLCYQIAGNYTQTHGATSDLDLHHNHPCSLDPNHQPCNAEHPKPKDRVPHTSITSQYFQPELALSCLKAHLSSLLSLVPSPKRPIVLILDGVDQNNPAHQQQIIQSLPSPLPPSVKLIISVSSRRTQALQAIRLHYPECAHVELKSAERKQRGKMVTSLLSSSGRSVTSGQQALINEALSSCSLIFYARLLHVHASLWTSDSEVMESSIPSGIHASISALLDHLEQKHGSSLVCRCLSHLTLSRTGLTEAELTDLLSCDDEVLMEHVLRCEAHPSRLRVPQVDVDRLLLDLRRFLSRRTVGGSRVLFWLCRHFDLVVNMRYLSCPKVRKEFHSMMADYFNGRWAYGNAKPLVIRNQEFSGIKGLGSGEVNTSFSEGPQITVYIDRQPAGQPFVFQLAGTLSSARTDVDLVNLRKILELPYHLKESDRCKELEQGVIMSLPFHQAMIQAGFLLDLVDLLEGQVLTGNYSRERALLAGMLKSTACILHKSPQELPELMETRLLPFVGAYPELEVYIQGIGQERRKRGSGIGVVLCPASSTLVSTLCSLSDVVDEQGSVTEAAVTDSGVVVGIMEGGSAWIWRSPWREVEELSLSIKQVKVTFSGVKSSGRSILLSTHCNRLLLWNVAGPEVFADVKGPLTTERVEGCVECEQKLCIWWKDKSYFCVFQGGNKKTLTFQCQNSVTCLVCSTDGCYVYCGQDKGIVSVFDINNTDPISQWSNPNQNAIISVILCKEQWDMACVDITGSITLWHVDGSAPQLAEVIECCSSNSGACIVNVDYSDELSTLLLCEDQQVAIWETNEWDLLGQFRAPRGKVFRHALLAQKGHLFLASFESCSHVLSWKICSGECVLSLDTGSNTSVVTLLKMTSHFTTITADGCLTVWDSEVICAAGMPQKMLSGVKEVAVDEAGERFYTIDGSESVWGWNLQTGVPDSNFFHDGPVEKLRLSPDNCHLVTLSGGDIYIWQKETGHNSFRIRGSRATDILLTPNSKFGVSLCESGISRVWNLASGGVVCHIHRYLADAKVSPESTFLIGLRHGDLLAVSLWSGSFSKRFSRAQCFEHVVAFYILPEQSHFVLVMGSSGGVYTWKVTEETVLQQFRLPDIFHCKPQIFQMSSAGSFVILSTDNGGIAFLDLSSYRICSVKVEGPIFSVCLDKTGCYAAYISHPSAVGEGCFCDMHIKAVLIVMRLADGRKVGALRLSKTPSALAMCEQLCVFVGFEDGSVGVYSIKEAITKEEGSLGGRGNLAGEKNLFLCDTAPVRLLPLAVPNAVWS